MTFEQLEPFEEWRVVVGYEGHYEVSNWGRVRSLARVYYSGVNHRIRKVESGRILVPAIQPAGYFMVTLCRDGKKVQKHIHRLVAETFLPNADPSKEVHHIDGNPKNNVVKNLVFVTHEEHFNEEAKCGTWATGEKHRDAKLTNAQVIEIRRLRTEGMTLQAIADQFGISATLVSRIAHNKTRKYG